jgi:hypothetical protein
MSAETRADYMMEAFLDEQNTLIRPLVSRKLGLVKILDERAMLIEKLLEEKRRRLLQSVSSKKNTNAQGDIELIERLEDDLEQVSEEKLNVLNQLMDLVRRPYDTIIEVESVLQSANAPTTEEPEPDQVSTNVVVKPNRSSTSSQKPWVQSIPSPPEEELWCYCRKPDDGRQMVACDNGKCDIVWWHIDCIDRYIESNRIGNPPPSDDSKWNCPVCITQQIVNREQEGNEKRKRRR